jgi:hypothetical protein
MAFIASISMGTTKRKTQGLAMRLYFNSTENIRNYLFGMNNGTTTGMRRRLLREEVSRNFIVHASHRVLEKLSQRNECSQVHAAGLRSSGAGAGFL